MDLTDYYIKGNVTMSLITKRQLPNLNNDRFRQLNSINTDNYTQHAQLNFVPFKQTTSTGDKVTHQNFDRQRKFPTPIRHEEDQISPSHIKSNPSIFEYQLQNPKRQLEENQINKSLLTQQNATTIRDSAKSIRENVTQFKNQLMRNEVEHNKQIPKNEELSSLLNRQRRTGQDYLQIENEYLINQQTILSKSTTLNQMITFKKELEKSERQRQQLGDQLESIIKISDEKDKVLSKTLMELKEVTENCETFERQNIKLQHDLTLALEKLEQMTEEAERFAYESLNSQKQLANSEQKQEEFQIQSQETIKQWNSRVKKLEKDIERYKIDSTQLLEKNEQLIKEIVTFKSQNFNLKEQNTKIENDLNQANRNSKRIEEQFKQNENNIIQLRTIHSSQQEEIETLKGTINQIESQLSTQRKRLSQTEKEKEHFQESLQEEIKHRNHLHSKLKQTQQDIQTINTSYSQLQNERTDLLQKLKEIQLEKDFLLTEKSKLNSLEDSYEEIKKKFEITKIAYTHEIKALQMDYENKIETFQLQLDDEKSQNTILQRHELELKQQIERLLEKLAKYENENTEGQCTIDILSTEINDKARLIQEFESKITKLTIEITNQKNEILKKEKDYQNSIHIVYEDIIDCTECLSTDSNKPFIIEPATTPRDHLEFWLSQIKAHLVWLKQELEIRQEQENKVREDFNNTLLDSETDRQYFSSELAKREIIIEQLTNHRTNLERTFSDTINDYDKQQILTNNDKDPFDHRYRQFQVMIDSVKRELHTAKVQLLT